MSVYLFIKKKKYNNLDQSICQIYQMISIAHNFYNKLITGYM